MCGLNAKEIAPWMISSEKRCYGCQLPKPRGEFHKARASADGLQDYCRQCRHEYDVKRNRARTAARRAILNAIKVFRAWGYMRPTQQFGLTMRTLRSGVRR